MMLSCICLYAAILHTTTTSSSLQWSDQKLKHETSCSLLQHVSEYTSSLVELTDLYLSFLQFFLGRLHTITGPIKLTCFHPWFRFCGKNSTHKSLLMRFVQLQLTMSLSMGCQWGKLGEECSQIWAASQ